jgi:hypothetical protein
MTTMPGAPDVTVGRLGPSTQMLASSRQRAVRANVKSSTPDLACKVNGRKLYTV